MAQTSTFVPVTMGTSETLVPSGGSHLIVVTRYIARQKEHYKKFTYREEVERLMKRYTVEEYNPEYYWD